MTVALVLVSHSRPLAEAARDLARQMAKDSVIAIAAGIGEDGQELGTDATAIAQALTEIDNEDGTLVLMDLGSAVLSADMALDLIDPALRARIEVTAAPFVEGAISAAVAAAGGLDRAAVAREAAAALEPKRSHYGAATQAPLASSDKPAAAGARATAIIADPHGLHARPAAALVKAAAGFEAEITISVEGGKGVSASAKSLIALSMLGARAGDTLVVEASGSKAAAAVEALAKLITGFGVDERQPRQQRPVPQSAAYPHAIPVSPGVALGRVVEARLALPDIKQIMVGDEAGERAKLQMAVKAVRQRLAAMSGQGAEMASVQLTLLDDPAFAGAMEARLSTGSGAAGAVRRVSEETIARYRMLADPVQAERASDIADVARALLENLCNLPSWRPPADKPFILLADDLAPSLAAELDPALCLGVVDRRGGATSHAAILLRGAGIPAVAAASRLLGEATLATLAFDGDTGEIWLEPDDSQRAILAERLERQKKSAARSPELNGAIHLANGETVTLLANVARLADARAARAAGAGGIGLLRTEMMYLDRNDRPSVAEQASELKAIFDVFSGYPITVRTLDAGADKPVPFLRTAHEANPYLGVRGIRLSLQYPDVFKDQLEAILTAGVGHDIRIMLPMVTEPSEVVAARGFLNEVHDRLAATGTAHCWPVRLGIMIEVPAAALTAATLAEVSDFFSIGTNDLTQYTLAAERGHPALGAFADAGHPAVLALIAATLAGASQRAVPVSVCGEAAGDERVAPMLVAAGVRVLSMSAARLAPLARRLQGR